MLSCDLDETSMRPQTNIELRPHRDVTILALLYLHNSHKLIQMHLCFYFYISRYLIHMYLSTKLSGNARKDMESTFFNTYL